MKSLVMLSIFIVTACNAAWTPSVTEIAQSAKEDSRDQAMAQIISQYNK